MKAVAFIYVSSTNKLEEVIKYLKNLSYNVKESDNKSFFLYKECSIEEMKRAIKTAKETAKFTNTLNVVYGTSTQTI